jgi:lysophospholipid acyltransferase (LPLAT)-like uncharacterized protein
LKSSANTHSDSLKGPKAPVQQPLQNQRSKLGVAILSWLLYVVFRIFKSTWRIEEDSVPAEIQKELAEGKTQIVAHFHEDEWALLGVYADKGMHALVSLSDDGSVMAAFLRRIGFRIARGSSSRNAIAGFLSLVRSLKTSDSRLVNVAVDGPKGPRRRTKNGVFKLADALDSPVMVVSAWCSNPWIFKRSWSKAFVPRPFSRVVIKKDRFLTVDEVKRMVARDDYAELCYKLEDRLKAVKLMAKSAIEGGAQNP